MSTAFNPYTALFELLTHGLSSRTVSTLPSARTHTYTHHTCQRACVLTFPLNFHGCRAFFFQQLTHLRLDRMHLEGDLPHTVLSALPRLTHVYLQHNQLTSMAGLCTLPRLRFAALSHNRIKQVRACSVGWMAGWLHALMDGLAASALNQTDAVPQCRSIALAKPVQPQAGSCMCSRRHALGLLAELYFQVHWKQWCARHISRPFQMELSIGLPCVRGISISKAFSFECRYKQSAFHACPPATRAPLSSAFPCKSCLAGRQQVLAPPGAQGLQCHRCTVLAPPGAQGLRCKWCTVLAEPWLIPCSTLALQVEGVAGLPTLMFLDLSHNQLQSLDVQQLPQSVGFLKARPLSCKRLWPGPPLWSSPLMPFAGSRCLKLDSFAKAGTRCTIARCA